MKVEISTYQAADLLLRDDNASWSRPAAFAIVEYFEELQEDCAIDFDTVAIRCEFSEYKSIQEAANQYADSLHIDPMEWLQDRTTVILTDSDAVVIQDF